jgi:antitoxin component YwqK of YwqJK toxin-antitoxin module
LLFFIISKKAIIQENIKYGNTHGHQHVSCTYKNGKKEGEYKTWYKNGQQHILCTYKNGKKEGEYKEWYKNKHQKVMCNYKNRILEGVCKKWDVNGVLIKDVVY